MLLPECLTWRGTAATRRAECSHACQAVLHAAAELQVLCSKQTATCPAHMQSCLQEKASNMEQQVRDLTEQLSTLTAQHEQLMQRNKQLELAAVRSGPDRTPQASTSGDSQVRVSCACAGLPASQCKSSSDARHALTGMHYPQHGSWAALHHLSFDLPDPGQLAQQSPSVQAH